MSKEKDKSQQVIILEETDKNEHETTSSMMKHQPLPPLQKYFKV